MPDKEEPMKTFQDTHQRRHKLGSRVHSRRLEVHKTKQELADQAHLSLHQVDQLEKGLMPMDVATEFVDISHALNIKTEKLLPQE